MATSIASTNAERSPILRLPRELRDDIYRYAILDQREVTISFREGCSSCNCRRTWLSPPPALLAMCQQVRLEASKIYYEETTFVAKEHWLFHRWLRKVERHSRALIRRVVYDSGFPRAEDTCDFQRSIATMGLDTDRCVLMVRLSTVYGKHLFSVDEIENFTTHGYDSDLEFDSDSD